MARYWSEATSGLKRPPTKLFFTPRSFKKALKKTKWGAIDLGLSEEVLKALDFSNRKFTKKEFKISAVLAFRVANGETQLLVRWKGYPESENTWEPWFNLRHTKAAADFASFCGVKFTPHSVNLTQT